MIIKINYKLKYMRRKGVRMTWLKFFRGQINLKFKLGLLKFAIKVMYLE